MCFRLVLKIIPLVSSQNYSSDAQTPTPALPSSIMPLQKFIVPHLCTSCLVSFSSPFPLCPLFDSSVIVPHISNRVYGASPTKPTAAVRYKFRFASVVTPDAVTIGLADTRYASVAKPSEELMAHPVTGMIPDSYRISHCLESVGPVACKRAGNVTIDVVRFAPTDWVSESPKGESCGGTVRMTCCYLIRGSSSCPNYKIQIVTHREESRNIPAARAAARML